MKKFKYLLSLCLWISVTWSSPYTFIHLDNQKDIKAEIVDTPKEMAKGLMWRKKLEANTGMLFVYPRKIYSLTFWMKNMIIPLDIIWLDESKQIVYYLDNVPPCKKTICPFYSPPINISSQYVLEIAAGERKKLDLKLSQPLNFNI